MFIPVMGMTGSGKSTFISQIAGHSLDSCKCDLVPVVQLPTLSLTLLK